MTVKKEKVPDHLTHAGKDYLYWRVAAKEYRIPPYVLKRWALVLPCAWTGRRIGYHKLRPQGYERRYVYLLKKDLDDLREAMEKGPAEDDKITRPQAVKEFGL